MKLKEQLEESKEAVENTQKPEMENVLVAEAATNQSDDQPIIIYTEEVETANTVVAVLGLSEVSRDFIFQFLKDLKASTIEEEIDIFKVICRIEKSILTNKITFINAHNLIKLIDNYCSHNHTLYTELSTSKIYRTNKQLILNKKLISGDTILVNIDDAVWNQYTIDLFMVNVLTHIRSEIFSAIYAIPDRFII